MPRHPHYLKRVHGNALPRHVIALAVQVRPGAAAQELSDLAAGKSVSGIVTAWHAWSWRWRNGSIEGEREYSSHDPILFWAWLGARLQPKSCTWIFVPRAYQAFVALGGFDALVNGRLELEQDPADLVTPGPDPKGRAWRGYLIAQDPPTIILFRPRGLTSTIKWLDPENYGVQIDTVGRTVNQQCQDVAKWLDHYRSWLIRENLGSWQHTAGSQAMHSFRRRFYRGGILVHDSNDALNLERHSYYGGRCECRRLGKIQGPVYHLDLNSAYMYVAGRENVPVAIDSYYCPEHPRTAVDSGPGKVMTARVELETDTPLYPLRVWSDPKHGDKSPLDLPVSELIRGQTDVIYPVGRFTTVLAWPELQHAMKEGRVRKIFAWATYHAKPIFRELAEAYAGWLSSDAAATCPAHRQMLKHFAVCLYGKFASWRRSWRACKGLPRQEAFSSWWGLHPETKELVQWRSILGQVQYRERIGEHNESCPAIAAHVTSACRMLLWRVIELCGIGNVYYYDTDSVWTNSDGYHRFDDAGMIDPDRIGRLKVAGVHCEVEFRGIKHYLADGKLIQAGTPDDADLDGGGGATWLSQEKMEAALCHGEKPRSKLIKHGKKWRRTYKHGNVDENGSVRPLVFTPTDPDVCPI